MTQRGAAIGMHDIDALDAGLKAVPPRPVPSAARCQDPRPEMTPPKSPRMNNSQPHLAPP
jgi:hypothetical protein